LRRSVARFLHHGPALPMQLFHLGLGQGFGPRLANARFFRVDAVGAVTSDDSSVG
jgi:hypothetical protein